MTKPFQSFIVGMTFVLLMGVASMIFWPNVILIAAAAIPVAVISSVVRTSLREARGERYDFPMKTGSIGISHLPQRAKKITHFSTPNAPDETKVDLHSTEESDKT